MTFGSAVSRFALQNFHAYSKLLCIFKHVICWKEAVKNEKNRETMKPFERLFGSQWSNSASGAKIFIVVERHSDKIDIFVSVLLYRSVPVVFTSPIAQKRN
jgi:hypothetical protein